MLDLAQKVVYLRKVPMFRELQLDELTQIAAVTSEVTLGRGERLFEQGDHGDALFVVLDGEIAIELDRQEIHRQRSGQSFGEIAVLDNAPRTATARAATDVYLLRLGRRAFNELLERRGPLRLVVLSELARQLARVRRRTRALERQSGSAARGVARSDRRGDLDRSPESDREPRA